jgi:hypothetical protein
MYSHTLNLTYFVQQRVPFYELLNKKGWKCRECTKKRECRKRGTIALGIENVGEILNNKLTYSWAESTNKTNPMRVSRF